jgi:cysteine-rich repeat protein
VVNFSATDSESQQALCPVTLVVTSQCGDGNIDPGEQCDPGADVTGDCCSSDCQQEPDGTTCGPAPTCGGPSSCHSGTCTPGAGGIDTDGDEVLDCQDNCPMVSHPDQSDIHGAGVGGRCERTAATEHPFCLNVTKLVMKARRRPRRAAGPASAATSSSCRATTDAAGGLTVRVKERLETDYQMTAPSCIVTEGHQLRRQGRKHGWVSRSPEEPSQVAVSYKFAIKFNKRSSLRRSETRDRHAQRGVSRGVDPVGQISDCGAQRTGLRCRSASRVQVRFGRLHLPFAILLDLLRGR